MDAAPTSAFTRRFITLPGRGEGALAVLDFGPADRAVDLIFLHANGFNALTYRRILAPPAGRYRVLAVDQRGHGASSLPTHTDGRADWYDFRDDLVALLEVLDLREVVLSGHSLGGAAALLAAAEIDGRVSRLVLFDPAIAPPAGVGPPGPSHTRLIEGARRRRAEFPSRAEAFKAYHGRGAFASWPDDMLADYVEAGFRDLPDGGVRLTCEPAWEASTFIAHANDPWRAFANTACPIEILRAERDSTCHAAPGAFAGERRIVVETVPGTSHFLPMERPELATERLIAALDAR
jgi:pimeloyl-ACP methyl ester carboxylesterase